MLLLQAHCIGSQCLQEGEEEMNARLEVFWTGGGGGARG